MNWNAALTTFGLLFLAEMGDKTQLATITMVARIEAPWAVFLGASLALVAVTLLGVLAGGLLSRWIPPVILHRAAAVGFIAIGALMLPNRAVGAQRDHRRPARRSRAGALRSGLEPV